ncbi:MAG: PDZ domain-containing protein [Polyangiaceae bacterium]|nr:PDZ domain-containing protein [Polyangiaceae bacterium]
MRSSRVLNVVAAILFALAVASLPGSRLRSIPVASPSAPLVDAKSGDAVLRVHVTAEGKPTEGARVRAFHGDSRGVTVAGTAKTDAAGDATLGNLPSGETWLIADRAGHSRASQWLILATGPRDATLELGTEASVDVVVMDEKGRPVDAEVEVSGGDPIPVGGHTDAKGEVHIGGLSGERFSVLGRARGFDDMVQQNVRAGSRVALVMTHLAALSVLVVDPAGKPAPDADVQITSTVLWPPRATRTGADGRVRIGSLGSGSYSMHATKGSLVAPTEMGILLGRGEEQTIKLTLQAGIYLTARVVEAGEEPDRGVERADVTLVENGLSAFPLEGRTGKDGRVRIGPILPGAASITANADDFVPAGPLSLPDPVPAEMRIPMERAGTIEGRVVDARGFPVGSAQLRVLGTDFQGQPFEDDPGSRAFRSAHLATMAAPTPALIPAGELGVMPGPVPPIPGALGASLLPNTPMMGSKRPEPWVTRADGTFRIEAATPGRVRVLARHPEFVEAFSDTVTLTARGIAHVDIVMGKGGTLEGKVVDESGRGVEGARVTLAARQGNMERSVRTASDGSFAFAAVPVEVSVSVTRDDDPTSVVARATATVPEDKKREITLIVPAPRGNVAVRVDDDRGYALDNVQVSAASLDPAEPRRATAFTDKRGEATLASLRGLPLRVELRAPGFAPKTATVTAEMTALRVALAPAESVHGEIRSRRGDPVEGAEITLFGDGGSQRAVSAPDGSWEIGGLGAGSATVRVRKSGFAPGVRTVNVPESRGRRPFEAPRIELSEEGVVEGVVVDDRNDPVPGARVSKDAAPVYLTPGSPALGVAIADARGRFRLGELAEGPLTLDAYAPDFGRARSEPLRVERGRTQRDVRIVLRKQAEKAESSNAAATVAVTLGETGEPREVVVAAVTEGSGADRGGLRPDDTLVDVDGKAVRTIAEARMRLSGPMGDDVIVRVRRAERTLVLRIARDLARK